LKSNDGLVVMVPSTPVGSLNVSEFPEPLSATSLMPNNTATVVKPNNLDLRIGHPPFMSIVLPEFLNLAGEIGGTN
jgi:hypothetical protein